MVSLPILKVKLTASRPGGHLSLVFTTTHVHGRVNMTTLSTHITDTTAIRGNYRRLRSLVRRLVIPPWQLRRGQIPLDLLCITSFDTLTERTRVLRSRRSILASKVLFQVPRIPIYMFLCMTKQSCS